MDNDCIMYEIRIRVRLDICVCIRVRLSIHVYIEMRVRVQHSAFALKFTFVTRFVLKSAFAFNIHIRVQHSLVKFAFAFTIVVTMSCFRMIALSCSAISSIMFNHRQRAHVKSMFHDVIQKSCSFRLEGVSLSAAFRE